MKTSGMLGDKAINVDETWSSPDGVNQGLVIGFKTNGDPIIEMTKCNPFYNIGQILSLENSSWNKVEPKRKVYVYYNSYGEQFYCTELPQKPHHAVHLMETREYNVKDLT